IAGRPGRAAARASPAAPGRTRPGPACRERHRGEHAANGRPAGARRLRPLRPGAQREAGERVVTQPYPTLEAARHDAPATARLVVVDSLVVVLLGALSASPLHDAYGDLRWLVVVVAGLAVGLGV